MKDVCGTLPWNYTEIKINEKKKKAKIRYIKNRKSKSQLRVSCEDQYKPELLTDKRLLKECCNGELCAGCCNYNSCLYGQEKVNRGLE